MAASLADCHESMLFEYLANLQARKNSELPNRHLNLRHENIAVRTSRDFSGVRSLEKESESLNQICPRVFDGFPLARHIYFRAQCHKSIVFAFNDRGQALHSLHDPSLQEIHPPSHSWSFTLTRPSDPTRGAIMATTTMEFTAVYMKVKEGYLAFIEELPGANTQGDTLDEARENLNEAVTLALEANRAMAEQCLEGATVIRESFVLPAA